MHTVKLKRQILLQRRKSILLWFVLSFFSFSFASSQIERKSIYRIHTSGLESQTPSVTTVILISGFPDTSDSWSGLTPFFESRYHVVTLALPDYEEETLNSFWGYSIEEMVDGIAEIARYYKELGSNTVYLIGHDWGAHLCLCLADFYRQSRLVDKIVLLDVGLRSSVDLDVVCISYMMYLAGVFLLSRISETMAMIAISLYPWSIFGPCRHSADVSYATKNMIHTKGFMTYPYFRALFSKLPSFVEDIPQLFLYGSEKPTKFHSKEYLDLLDNTKNSAYKEITGCGHWLHWCKTEEIVSEIQLFFDKRTTISEECAVVDS